MKPETPACVFCSIIAGTAPAQDVTRYMTVTAFTPLNPVVGGHRLFVPNEHLIDAAHTPFRTGETFAIAAAWGELQGEQFNLITNNGPDATQSVFHLHVHYVPRKANDGLPLPWFSGKSKAKPSDEQLAAEQWAHLRKYYVKGEQA